MVVVVVVVVVVAWLADLPPHPTANTSRAAPANSAITVRASDFIRLSIRHPRHIVARRYPVLGRDLGRIDIEGNKHPLALVEHSTATPADYGDGRTGVGCGDTIMPVGAPAPSPPPGASKSLVD